ncbi:hypothetical protein B0J14DRAFT_296470 [Halenospora varia]|nr:hypothetical protein B0J14DRAFT_296470 [Halenospora varia]
MVSFLSTLAVAAAAIASVTADNFTLTASAPGLTAFDGKAINAGGQRFWVGLAQPIDFCPTLTCASAKNTQFTSITTLNVQVPGGQQVYVAADGGIQFTNAANGEFTIPAGAVLATFTLSDAGLYTGLNNAGIQACPTGITGFYQLYTPTAGFVKTGCTKLAGVKPNVVSTTGFGAYAYA